MTEKYITYKMDGRTFEVPESKSSFVEKKYPNATIEMHMDDKVFDVPVSRKAQAISKYPNVSFAFDRTESVENNNEKHMPTFMEPEEETSSIADILRDEDLSWRERRKAIRQAKYADDSMSNTFETTGKAVGAASATTAKMAVDAVNVGAKMGSKTPIANNPLTSLAATIEAFTGKSVLDKDNPLNEVSENLGEVAERLSKESDPTGGEMGFGELLKRGHIGLAMQKALGSGIESAPIMLATKHPATATLYMLGAAASNYEDETRDNPDIPEWKRGVNAVGSAALEMVVEKFADIPWKYFGKAGGEITDDIARNVIERVREEGVQTIAKRIKRVIGNTAKDSISEGFEEVITGLGNDALGSALDAIDGNSDYGFDAQWKEYKSQNPEATKEDFALAKGKEYMESFLGGALSSIYIAGFGNIAKESIEAKKRREFDNAYIYGADLDYEDMYDTNDDVKISLEDVVEASKNKKGEETLTKEFIENLSAEEAFALSRSEDVKSELRTALADFAIKKAKKDGLDNKLTERTEGDIKNFTTRVNEASENGEVVSAIHNNKTVFVKGGVVKADGTVTLPNGQHGPVIVVDGNDKYTVDSKELSDAWSQNTDEYIAGGVQSFKDRDSYLREWYLNTIGPKAKARAVRQYVNKKILINTENGGMAQVEVQEVLPSGQVLVKGKKGDLGGQSERLFGPSAFYDAIVRNDDGTPTFVEDNNYSQRQPPKQTETTADIQQNAPEEASDFRESKQIILINNTPTTVEVINQDDVADRVTYTYTDDNGQTKTGSSTVAGFAEAIKQAEDETTVEIPERQLNQNDSIESPIAPENTEQINSTDELPPIPDGGVPTVPDVSSTTAVTNSINGVTAPIFPSSDVHDETPLQKPKGRKDEEENIQLAPEDIDWDALFEQDKEAYFNELQNQFGDNASEMIGGVIDATQHELDSINKKKGKNQKEIFANINRKKVLQAKIDELNTLAERLNKAPETSVENAVAEDAMPEQVDIPMQKDPEPVNGVEFAARELGLRDGGIKLLVDSFKHHTGYGSEEVKKLFGLFRKKSKGGMTIEEAGERLMELDRENSTGFFDQNDPNAGMNAILEALSLNRTMGELRSYAAREQQVQAQKEANAAYSAMMAEYEARLGESIAETVETEEDSDAVIWEESSLTDEDYEEFLATFTDETNEHGTDINERETPAVSGTEEAGNIQTSEGGVEGSSEAGNTVLQAEQPVHTRGEAGVETESAEVGGEVSEQNVVPSVPSAEQSEVESILDEDMPDFATETPKVPVALNRVDNPVESAQTEEKKLLAKLERVDMTRNEKRDWAYKYGKKVADMFATREDYGAYEEIAADLGEFIEDFDRGVEESFANRQQFHIGEEITDSDVSQEAIDLVNEAVDDRLDGYVEVERPSDETVVEVLELGGIDNQFSIEPNKPIFISNAALAVQGIKMDKATPGQWLKMIEKAGGLKTGEDKWMGLSDWLKSSNKKTLTKQEVLDYISANTIQIEEVTYVPEIDRIAEEMKHVEAMNDEFVALRQSARESGESFADAGEIAYQQMAEKYGDDFTFGFGVDMGELYVSNIEAASTITGIELNQEREINDTRLKYTTEGLENKKEIAIVVPTTESWNEYDDIHFGDAGDGRAVAWVRFGETTKMSSTSEPLVLDKFAKPYKNVRGNNVYKPTGSNESGTYIVEKDTDGKKIYTSFIKDKAIGNFESFDEAKDALNKYFQENPTKRFVKKRVLVIDEIQSKRHQEGREKGYKSQFKNSEKAKELEARVNETKARLTELVNERNDNKEVEETELYRLKYMLDEAQSISQYDAINEERDRIISVIENRNAEIQQVRSELNNLKHQLDRQLNSDYIMSLEAIPDAPFEKNWSELAMKRMLRYAAENGYDAIAWTKGEQQAERYNLSKQVDSIEADDNTIENFEDGTPIAKTIHLDMNYGESIVVNVDSEGNIRGGQFAGNKLDTLVGKELAVKLMNEGHHRISGDGLKVGGEGMKGFYDKMLPAFMNKYGKKWGVSVGEVKLNGLDHDFRMMHSIPVTEAMKQSVMEGQPMFFKTPNGIVYGWTDGKKIYLTKAGMNPNTKIHEYTHLWAKAMMQKNPKGWNSIKQLLKNTPVWKEVMNDANYSDIHGNEDMVTSEVLSRLSGTKNAAKLERMAQQMIDEAKGTMRKAEARGLIQNIKEALQKFWNWVGVELFGIEEFESVEQITDRVLYDLVNNTNIGELSEGQVETQIVTDPKVIAELEASPKKTGYRNVVKNADGSYDSPMAFGLQGTTKMGGAKSRIKTNPFVKDKWEKAEEHPELVDENGHIVLVKPNNGTLEVAYDPYIHNRLEPVNLQFKDAWKRDDLVYVETEVPVVDLESGYHAEGALLPVGVHPWSNGEVMLSMYDKPVGEVPWDKVADAWAKRLKLNGKKGVHFDVVSPSLRQPLIERGVKILPPHKNMGKDCNDAYAKWKKENPQSDPRDKSTSPSPKVESNQTTAHAQTKDAAKIAKSIETLKELSQRSKNERVTSPDKIVNYLADALNITIKKGETNNTSKRNKYVLPSGETLSVRVSKHNVSARTYIEFNFNQKYNLAITFKSVRDRNNFKADDNVRLDEYVYFTERVRQYNGSVLSEVALSLANFLETGIYEDTTSLAIVNTSPTGAQPRTKENYSSETLSRRTDIQNAAVDYLVGDPRLKAIENAVNEEAKKLNVNVTYKTRSEMPAGHKNDKGYYNTSTGEIVICTENASSVADAIQTILHEAVAHKGLRQLMGDKFNEFINRVYNSLDAETKAKVDALAAEQYDGNTAVAMEEYMASLGETENFAENSVWDTIKSIFEDIINAILGRNDIKIGDNELRYILRASYNNMVNPKGMESVKGWAQDQLMREQLGINEASTPEILSRTGIDDIAFTNAREAYETVTFNGFTEIMNSIMSATGFKAKMKEVKTGLLKIWNEFQMENQEAQQAVITGIEAIQRETGDMPIEDFENYLLAENQMQSRAAEEIESFLNNQFAAIVDQINDIITSVMKARGMKYKNKNLRAEVYKEVRQYLIAKHGLERNKYYQNSTGEMRDFSGLTALFGLPDTEFALAETMAQDMVDKFEAEIGDAARDALWNKINAATRKTLRHAFESGLLSRAQHDKIRDMFDFYIPLRGFEETTAEDVYNYASYDGNRFQPAVRTAQGRTSVAFDPIAVIMNMAQSEIIQGNKNRVKQALYHFIGNRPNSLLTPRECWYVLDKATGAFVEAYPDIANGETWEQFEIRMQALEATGDAMKQKKGLDVGYRFQKPTNKDNHYIHLKINGVEHAIYVNGNPRLAEGVNGFDKTKIDEVMSGVKKANRWSSQLFTNYNYKFGGKNFFRDFIWAQTVMFIKESPMYNLRFAGNWFANNPITIGSLMRKYKNGTLDMTNQNDVLFKEFIENGGKTGYVFIDALDRQKRRIDKAIERMSKIGNTKTNALTKAAILFEIINYANECIELTARFATYVTSRNTKDKSGNVRSIMQSINDAKSITTNFNRKGAQSGRGLIGGIANFMGSWNMFYNAAVQGVQQVKGLNNNNPVKTKVFLGGWVALGFMMPYIINIFRGDDDDEIYWNLPEYERKNNICLPFGKGKVTMTIPLSPIVREGYAIGVTLNDAMFNKSVDKDATMLSMECATLLAKAFLPANPVEGLDAGLTPAENLLMFGTPDIADPLVEAVINKDWTGSPIEYRTTYNEGAPHYTKVIGKDNWKERVGEKLYKAGEDNLDSSLDINLSAWEHIFSSGVGGLGVFAKDITNIIDWVTEWKAPERLNDIPVARTLLSSNAMDDEKFVNMIYWDLDDIYKKKAKNIKSVYNLTEKDAFGKEEGRGDANLVKVYEAKSYPFLKRYYELNKEIKTMQNEIDKMPTDTEVEKNDKVLAEQELFNKRRDLVYELLEYEIE